LVAVKDAAEQAVVLAALQAAGVVVKTPSSGETGSNHPSGHMPPTVFDRPATVPAHKVLFHATEAGKVAVVRQLRPSLHVDTAAATLRALVPHVKGKLLEVRAAAAGETAMAGAVGQWPVVSRAWFFEAA
jgi:hypothetical protein